MTQSIQPVLPPDVEADFLLNNGAPFSLESGATLPQVSLRYATYGKLNAARDNAILVCHGLSGSARVADWWQEMFLNDHPLDPRTHYIIGINALGSCYGSTGPTSLNPETGKPYGYDFPVVSIRDIVRGQVQLMDHLGISCLRAAIGPSIGGMQALQWAVDFPDRVANCFATGATPLSAMGLALNHLQRESIRLDPAWLGGHYPPDRQPARGLALARGIASCTYKSAELFTERFGHKPNRTGNEDPTRSHEARYDVAGYLDYQGKIFIDRFDANSYLVITRAMDTFDLARGYLNERTALARITARVLLVGISSDWLFPAADIQALADRCQRAGATCNYVELHSHHGHDAFLAEAASWRPFVEYVTRSPRKASEDSAYDAALTL
ncbi:MAG TPA: homoserine O-acetyltransferase [Acidobacteriaceae bacterium]|jgi:homoserine O-acetyltransferase|nr:homoserine O-acetyltransferase [Acidobacteriaceae bacterium]